MAERDYSFPDGFPDLSIPEREDSRGRPPAGQPARPPGRASWRAGDRVLAPWEPNCLYAGRVVQVEGDRALIQFDDGDAGRVPLSRVQPLSVRTGQKVLSRRRRGHIFYPATIDAVDGDRVRVRFDDGRDEWTTVAALRIPCPPGPGAEPTTVASHQAFARDMRQGDRVWAPWNSGVLYAGTVDQIKDGELHVRFDDGDAGWVLREQVLPLDIPVGLRVFARLRMGPMAHPATVTEVQGERIHVRYDDGKEEWTKPAALCVAGRPSGPDARATRGVAPQSRYALPGRAARPTGFNLGPGTIWVVFLVIGLLAAMTRGCH